MSDLRETLVDMAVTHGNTRSRQDSEDFVDDILALIADRLTSNAAIDAANYAIPVNAKWSHVAAAITAALEAAGVVRDGE